MVVICKVGARKFRKGDKTVLSYPAMTSGTIRQTYCSKTAAMFAKNRLDSNQRNRAKIRVL